MRQDSLDGEFATGILTLAVVALAVSVYFVSGIFVGLDFAAGIAIAALIRCVASDSTAVSRPIPDTPTTDNTLKKAA
jgi:hypothetical protein